MNTALPETRVLMVAGPRDTPRRAGDPGALAVLDTFANVDAVTARTHTIEIDRRNARLAIRNGVKGAEDQWVSAPMIAEALTMELVSYVQAARSPSETAAFLRALAEAIEAQPNIN